MNLEKAIEILKSPKFGTTWPAPLKEKDALKLGIEAMKAIIQARDIAYSTPAHYLPGETKE